MENTGARVDKVARNVLTKKKEALSGFPSFLAFIAQKWLFDVDVVWNATKNTGAV